MKFYLFRFYCLWLIVSPVAAQDVCLFENSAVQRFTSFTSVYFAVAIVFGTVFLLLL